MRTAIRGRPCTAEICQYVLRIAVVHDVRLTAGRRLEPPRMTKKVSFAERDAVRVDERLRVALSDSLPTNLVRRGQVDEYGLAAGLHHGCCPQGTFFLRPESVVDHDFLASRQELLHLQGDVFEDRGLSDEELTAGEVAAVVPVSTEHLLVRAKAPESNFLQCAGKSGLPCTLQASHEDHAGSRRWRWLSVDVVHRRTSDVVRRVRPGAPRSTPYSRSWPSQSRNLAVSTRIAATVSASSSRSSRSSRVAMRAVSSSTRWSTCRPVASAMRSSDRPPLRRSFLASSGSTCANSAGIHEVEWETIP